MCTNDEICNNIHFKLKLVSIRYATYLDNFQWCWKEIKEEGGYGYYPQILLDCASLLSL